MNASASRQDDYSRATLNILEDFAAEKTRLEQTERAIVNILDDTVLERAQLEAVQRAVVNILEDFAEERARAEAALVDLHQAVEMLRVANAKAEAANAELDAFSYSAAHDLRAPLRIIDGFSQALSEDCGDALDDEGRRYIAHIRSSVKAMADLIEGLLTLARVTRGKLRYQAVDLSQVARHTIERLRQLAPERRVDVVIADHVVVRADQRLIAAVLDNLLGNAWKFTAKRDLAQIEFGRHAAGGETVYFVRDNGAGFQMEFVDKLFGVFQRLHSSHDFEGTGVGLATVQRIVRRHGGRIWAEGAEGHGATFSFTLAEDAQA